jgi:arylsulfatase A-like enzyme
LNQTLNLLEELNLTDDTVVIKTADHGEMAMSHNGQVNERDESDER